MASVVTALLAVLVGASIFSITYLLATPQSDTVLSLSRYDLNRRRSWFDYWNDTLRRCGISPSGRYTAGVVMMAAPAVTFAAGFLLTRNLLLAAVMMTSIFFIPWAIFTRQSSARARKLDQALPRFIAELAHALNGKTLDAALRQANENSAEPLKSQISQVTNELSSGVPMDEALLALAERNRGSESMVSVAATLLFYHESGAQNVSSILRQLSSVIVEAQEFAAETRAETRFLRIARSALVMSAVMGLAIGFGLEPAAWASPFGYLVLGVVVAIAGGAFLFISGQLRKAQEVS